MPEAALCVICSGELQRPPAVRVGEFHLLKCGACKSWTAAPRPTAHAQHSFHDSDSYFDHPYLAHRRAQTELVDRRCAAIFERIGAVLDLAALRGERVMDVGCDTGDFVLSAAKQFGVRPVGIDVARRSVERARAAKVDAYQCALEDAPSELRDLPVITAIDLIEHVADPRSFFTALFDRLRPHGVAYVETPNVDSWVYEVGRVLSGWTGGRPLPTFQRLFPPEHIQYFSPAGLSRLAEACGLRVRLLESRVLPAAEIAVGSVTRLALGVLQGLDRMTGDKVLRWAILERPAA